MKEATPGSGWFRTGGQLKGGTTRYDEADQAGVMLQVLSSETTAVVPLVPLVQMGDGKPQKNR